MQLYYTEKTQIPQHLLEKENCPTKSKQIREI